MVIICFVKIAAWIGLVFAHHCGDTLPWDPLCGGYSMADVCAGRWLGRGVGRPVGGGGLGVLDTRFAVVGGGKLGIPKACCRVYLLERIPMRSSRLQFISE